MTHRSAFNLRWLPLALAALVLLTAPLMGEMSVEEKEIALGLMLLGAVGTILASTWRLSPVWWSGFLAALFAGAIIPAERALADRLAPQSGIGTPWLCVVLPVVAVLVVAFPTFARNIPGTVLTVVFVAVASGFSVNELATVYKPIDVYEFLTRGVDALLHGSNAYSTTYPNIYPTPVIPIVYGPGVVDGDHLTYGFPYLPTSLLSAIPGYLLGDVRLSGVVLLGLLALVVAVSTPGRRGRLVAVTLVAAPVFVAAYMGAWTEPAQVALLGFAAVAMRFRRLAVAAVLLGLVLTTKQYFVFVLPALWLLRSTFALRHYAIAASTALITTVPFFLADPAAFWRAVVDFQLVQPFRSDSTSLLVLSVTQYGWPPPAVYGVLPVAAGLGLAVLLAWRLRPGPSAFCLATALVLLITVALSKQAFLNYYTFIGGAVLVAAWLSTPEDPTFGSLPDADRAQPGTADDEAGAVPPPTRSSPNVATSIVQAP